MAVQFRDYYEILGVERSATQDEIQRAFRVKARTAHPDVSKAPDAQERFVELNEAYEVLKDPDKRSRYDRLGSRYRDGDAFSPPPGWSPAEGGVEFDFGGGTGARDFGSFSDFFSSLFGGGGAPFGTRQHRGPDHAVALELTLEQIVAGGKLPLQIGGPEPREYGVDLPEGLTEGSRIRLSGQGGAGLGGGPAGDLILQIGLRPHPRFAVDGHDLRTRLAVAPWEAALGARVELQTLQGAVNLAVPAGSASGVVLRLRGQGLPRGGGAAGDLLAEIQVVVPTEMSAAEREACERWAAASSLEIRERCSAP